MKPIYKLLMAGTVLVFAWSANAGQQYKYVGNNVYGQGGSWGGSYLSAGAYCNEYSDGMGGILISGNHYIYGWIAGNQVNENHNFSGLDACPDIFARRVTKEEDQEVHVSLAGITVHADCTNQTYSRGSGSGHTKSPGEKPSNYTNHWDQHYTTDGYNGTCVITATDAAGNSETYGNYASASAYEQFQNRNR